MNVSLQERDTTTRRVARKEGSAIMRGKYKQKKRGHWTRRRERRETAPTNLLRTPMPDDYLCHLVWPALFIWLDTEETGDDKRRIVVFVISTIPCTTCFWTWALWCSPTSFALKKTDSFPRNLWPSFAEW